VKHYLGMQTYNTEDNNHLTLNLCFRRVQLNQGKRGAEIETPIN